MRLKVSNVCQLLDKSKFSATTTQNGVTITNNGDGKITVNGTATANVAYDLTDYFSIDMNHKYIVLESNSGTGNRQAFISSLLDKNHYRYGGYYPSNGIFKFASYNGMTPIKAIGVFYAVSGEAFTNRTISNFMLFDLTEMYGAGNEPTTVEQFRQDFPNEMYEYSPVCWKKFRRLKYIANKEPVQLLDKSKYRGSSTVEGITFTNNGDGTWTVVGTAPDVPANKGYVSKSIIVWNLEFSKKHFIPGHKIVVAGGVSMDSAGKVADVQWVWGWTGGYDAANSWERTVHTIRQYPEDKLLEWSNYIELRVYAGATVNFTFKPQFFDLTEMYGAGNEPTTVAQFRADFPNELYDYNLYNYLTLNRGKYIANKEPVQLLDKSDFKTVTSKNVTATPDITNGMWTISGAATASEYLQIGVYYPGTDFNIGDKLFLRNSNIDNSVYFPYAAWYDKDNKYLGEYDGMGVFSVTNPKTAYIACYFTTRTVGNINVTTQVQLFNLTRMYGKGNEPTAAEFVAQYPGFDYPVNKYNAITFR